jgi:protein SCO1/2
MMRTLIVSLSLLFLAPALADSSFPPASIYHLSSKLTNQSGQQHGLDIHRGHPVLITMFYGSCAHTCPLLIETVRAVERAAPNMSDLRVLMVSIDPQRDTVTQLKKLATQRHIDLSRWTLANTDASTVRKIADALSIQYKQSDDGEFNHSSVISVLNLQGEITRQSAALGKADPSLVESLRAMQRTNHQ